jgi:hypothetical protein
MPGHICVPRRDTGGAVDTVSCMDIPARPQLDIITQWVADADTWLPEPSPREVYLQGALGIILREDGAALLTATVGDPGDDSAPRRSVQIPLEPEDVARIRAFLNGPPDPDQRP